MIKVSNVTKIYKDKTELVIALDNISMQLPNKGFIGLAGENGCGKTTFLNLLSTLDSDFEGDIYIDNLSVKDNVDFIRRRIVSFVFQENIFVKNLSVKDNILLFNSQSDFSKFQYFEIDDKKDKLTNELSGGQKQKVSLIRGLEKEYDILLVDEPTSSLDEHTTKQVFELLSTIAKEKLVILVSHDTEMMNAYCNLIIRLNGGKLDYIKNNNTISDVIYDDFGVIFYGDVNLHSISLEKMNEILGKNKSFVIKKEDLISNSKLDYSSKTYVLEKTKIDANQNRLLFKSFLKNTLFRSVIFSLILVLFITMLSIFYDFRFFNSKDFMYETLSKNQNSYLICDQDVVETPEQILRKTDLIKIASDFDTNIDISKQINTDNNYEFKQFSIYKPYIPCITYTNFKNFNFVAGTAPTDTSQIAITDYIADALVIAESKYSNYDDIINKGILLGDQNVKIFGIIDTDYETYNKESLSRKEEIDFTYYYQNIYSSLFYYNSFESSEYEGFFINACDSFANLKIDDSIQRNYCKVNPTLASLLDYDGTCVYPLKTIYGEFYVNGIIDDLSGQSNIYFSEDIKKNINNDETFDGFMADISKRDVFDLLLERNVHFFCYSATYAEDAIDTINLLQKLFAVFISIIIIGASLYLLSYYRSIEKTNNNLYYLTLFNGFGLRQYMLTEIKSFLIYFASILALNVLLYYALYNVLNAFLTNTFKIKIFIFNDRIFTPFISFIIIFVIAVIIYALVSLLRKNKNLIKFIK